MLHLDDVAIRHAGFTLTADLTISAGVTSVIGPSGGGKSTLLGAIGGFVPLERGRITWQGTDLAKRGPADRPVSLLFQDNNLFPHLSVQKNLALAFGPRLRVTAEQADQIAVALDRVGLTGYADRLPGSLSGGQQSRAGLARVLLQDRPIVLLDEPFAALGPAMRAEMLALVAEVLQGRTVLMVTHDPTDLRRIGGDLIVVADGSVSAPAPALEMLDSPPPALRDYLGQGQ